MTLKRYKPEDKRGMPPLVENDQGEYVRHDDVLELIFKILTEVSNNGSDTTSDDYDMGKVDAEGTIMYFLEEENDGETY